MKIDQITKNKQLGTGKYQGRLYLEIYSLYTVQIYYLSSNSEVTFIAVGHIRKSIILINSSYPVVAILFFLNFFLI